MWKGKQIYGRIEWHLAVVTQFQVQGHTLYLFLSLITKTFICCWIQRLWRETKFNSRVFVTRVLCLLHKSRRNKGGFLLNFNFENVGPISGFCRCSEPKRYDEGLGLDTQAISAALKPTRAAQGHPHAGHTPSHMHNHKQQVISPCHL